MGQCSQGLVLLLGSATVPSVGLLHALTTARTACSSDTDHSFVLGIVLDSCNRSEHASASGFSTGMQRVLPHFPPCTHSKEVLLPRAGPQSSPASRDSLCPVPSTHLRSNPCCFPASPLLSPHSDEEKSGNFTQERPKTKQMNKHEEFTEKFQKYKKGKHKH